MLQELIQKLQKDHGLTSEQSTGILSTVTGFIKEKFPMMKDAVDKMFAAEPVQPQSTAAAQPASEEKKEEHSFLDKISDMIPGQAGEKIETFAKGAAHKAEEVFDTVKDKVGGLFSSKKEESK
jgi:hypothetical protein